MLVDWLTPGPALIAIIVCLVARWTSVYIPLTALGVAHKLDAQRIGLSNLPTWGGLRGGLALAMALSLPQGPEQTVILHMTFAVVAFSIIVQRLSIGRLFSPDMMRGLLPPAPAHS